MAITSYPDYPYFDDINSPDISGLSPLDKNYLRLLFKPGVSIQTRELNQIQSLLQSQVDKLGQSIFKTNSPILGAECSFDANLHYVDCTIGDDDINDFNSIKDNLVDLILSQESGTPGIGTTLAIVSQIENLTPNSNRIYFQYKAGDGTFNQENAIGLQYLDNLTSVNLAPTAIGKAVAATLKDGIYFTKGCVVSAKKQYTVQPLKAETTQFSGFVALKVEEKEINSNEDRTLLDNAAGSLNFAASGADRYQLILTLTIIQESELPKDADYIQVLKISDSVITKVENPIDTTGSNLEKILAQRTYEESGDYIVKDFSIENQEVIGDEYTSRYSELADIAQFGLTDVNEAANHFVTTISPGIAYVSGSRVENAGANTILGDKARTTYSDLNSNEFFDASITADLGSYVEGFFATPSGQPASGAPVLDLNSSYNLIESSTTIGNCKIQSVEKISDNNFRLYLYDINFTAPSKNFKNVTNIGGVAYTGYGTLSFSVSTGSAAGQSKLNLQTSDSSLFKWSQQFVKSVRNLNVTQKMYFTATVANNTAVFNTSDGSFDKSPANISVWSNNSILTGAWNITPNQPGDVLTLTGLTNGHTVRVLASVTTDITSKRGTKTLTTENLSAFKNSNNENIVSPLVAAIPVGTIITLTGVYHAVSVNDPRFELVDDGQYPNSYKEAKLKALVEIPISTSLTINATHWKFSSVDNTGLAYYTVNSYIKPGQTTPVEISDIPFYRGERLSDYIDTRTLPTSIDRLVLDPYSPITAEIDFYLPRKDRLVADNSGQFKFIQGIPAVNPALPDTPEGTLTLYEFDIPAYTNSVGEITNKKINHKRYTMRDIERIEKRVGTLEYYTSLSLLEKSVTEKGIYDNTGTERFKNGFVTDSFRNFGTVDLNNPQNRSTFDRENGKLYPYKLNDNIKFSPVSTNQPGIKVHRSNAMLDYDIVEATEYTQLQATQFISIQPHDVVASVGVLQLYPEVDTWSDRTTTPPVSIDLFPGLDDTIATLAQNIPGLLGTDWNLWKTTSVAVTRPTQRLQVTTTNQVRTGTQTSVVTDNINTALGKFVTDVNIRPFMRSRSVRFRAAGLKANSTYYFFFDGVNVTSYVRPVPLVNGVIPPIGSFDLNADEGLDEATLLSKYPSGTIISDADGVAEGIFIVPNNPKLRFASGDGTFRITNSSRNLEDETLSRADARFISNGLGITSGETIVSTQVPRIQVTPVTANRTIITTERIDPVAQTFRVSNNGMFVGGLEVFFASKPNENRRIGVRAYIVRTSNGYPTSSIVSGSEIVLPWDKVNTSDDSSLSTRFNYDAPIYVPGGEYAIVIFSESPEYAVYIAEMGSEKRDLLTGQIVNKQPALGVFFTSSNKTTWSAWQNRDLKLKIHRAKFKNLNGTIRFKPVIPSGIKEIKISATNTIANNTGWPIDTTVTVSSPSTGGINAIATPIFDPNTRAITGFNITQTGSGYTSEPNVIIASVSASKTVTLKASLFGYSVSSFSLNMKRVLYSTTQTTQVSPQTGQALPTLGNRTSSNVISKVKLGSQSYSVSPLVTVEKLNNKNYTINNITSSESETSIEVTLTSNSDYYSPIVDLDSLSLETSAYDLNSSKYFTKEIKLTNPADRLDVYLDVNRPTTSSNIALYAQFKDANGVATDYQLISPVEPRSIPISNNPNSYSEIKFTINPTDYFSSFTIRIDFIGVDSTDICTVKDLRAIATL